MESTSNKRQCVERKTQSSTDLQPPGLPDSTEKISSFVTEEALSSDFEPEVDNKYAQVEIARLKDLLRNKEAEDQHCRQLLAEMNANCVVLTVENKNLKEDIDATKRKIEHMTNQLYTMFDRVNSMDEIFQAIRMFIPPSNLSLLTRIINSNNNPPYAWLTDISGLIINLNRLTARVTDFHMKTSSLINSIEAKTLTGAQPDERCMVCMSTEAVADGAVFCRVTCKCVVCCVKCAVATACCPICKEKTKVHSNGYKWWFAFKRPT